MCPACIATTVLTVVGTGSAGGLFALVAKLLRNRSSGERVGPARLLECARRWGIVGRSAERSLP